MNYTTFEDCFTLVDVAVTLSFNLDKSCQIDERTVTITKNEFPLFLQTAKVFWGDDFYEVILTPEEEEEAMTALINMITNDRNHVKDSRVYAKDALTVIVATAKMIDRAESYIYGIKRRFPEINSK